MPEIAATVIMSIMGRMPNSTLGTGLALPAEEPELEEPSLLPEPEPEPEPPSAAPAPVPLGWLVTVPVPAVPAWAIREEQVEPGDWEDLVVAAPSKSQADAWLELDWSW